MKKESVPNYESVWKVLMENAKQLDKLSKNQDRTDRQLAKTDAQLAKTDKNLDKMMDLYGNVSNNIGKAAEEYFYNSLSEKMVLNNIKYDAIDRNKRRHKGDVQGEFDIVLSNGEYLSIIETKQKVAESDVEKLRGKKVKNFRYLYPLYKNHKIFLGVAGMIVPSKVEALAKSYGFMVIKQKGDTIEVISEDLQVY